MMTDEQQWNRLRNEFHFFAAEFLNYTQTLSAADLNCPGNVRKLVAMRHKVVDAFLHIFLFVEDANQQSFYDILKDLPAIPDDKANSGE